MKSRNVKIIDEHGIDRNANIICGINVLGFDYVIYSITRDEENDNLFVSKVIRNIDGTYNMINVEEQMEKSTLTDIVKELVTYAVNTDGKQYGGNRVSLSNGTIVLIFEISFNKEQSINVTKTYITTVKKFVTAKTVGCYDLNSFSQSAMNSDDVSFFEQISAISDELPKVDEVDNSKEFVLEENSSIPQNNFVSNDNSDNSDSQSFNIDVNSFPVIGENINDQISNSYADVSDFINTDINKFPGFEESSDSLVNDGNNLNDNTVFEEKFDFGNVGEHASDVSSSVLDVSAPKTASTSELPIPTVEENIVSEFAQDDGNNDVQINGENMQAGFAGSIFFVIISILFFTASCIFLGYEVYKYIKFS